MFLVFNKEKIQTYIVSVLTVAVLITIANVRKVETIQTSSQEKELPIYNVQTDEKKVAFTMNCAWNADDIDKILETLQSMGIFNTYLLLVLAGTVKYIPFASRSALSSMMQLSGEIEEAAIIQDIPWHKRMLNIIIPIQKSSIMSGYLLPFITCVRELTLFMLLCSQTKIITTMLDYFDEMGLYAFSSGINLILIVFILICNALINKLTGASLDKGIGGE